VNVGLSDNNFFFVFSRYCLFRVFLYLHLKSRVLILKKKNVCFNSLICSFSIRWLRGIIPSFSHEYKLCWLTAVELQLLASYPHLFVFSCESVSPFWCIISILFVAVSLLRYGCWTRFICFSASCSVLLRSAHVYHHMALSQTAVLTWTTQSS